jgi:hypothetical protein
MLKSFMRGFTVLFILLICFAAGYAARSFNIFGNLSLFGPPQINIVTVLERIQGMSQLTTTRFTFRNQVTFERDMPAVIRALYGERVVFDVVGHVDAGIDLSALGDANITQDGDTLVVQLPPPTLQDCFMDENESGIRQRDTGLFTAGMTSIDQEVRRRLIAIIRDEALESDILTEAQTRTEIVLGELITSLMPEGTTVRIVPAVVDVNAPLPETCA